MNLNGADVQIMWKEIAIIFLFVFILRNLLDVYIITAYKRIHNNFCSGNLLGLEDKLKSLQKLSNIFSNGPFNKNIRLIYNNVCILLASLAFLDNDDTGFITQLFKIKKEEEFEIKHFMLALYYRYKGNYKKASCFYEKYLKCNHRNQDVKLVMKCLFENNGEYEHKQIEEAINKFQNPAIKKLLK